MEDKPTPEVPSPENMDIENTTPEKPSRRKRPLWIFLIAGIAYAVLMFIVLTGFLLIALR